MLNNTFKIGWGQENMYIETNIESLDFVKVLATYRNCAELRQCGYNNVSICTVFSNLFLSVQFSVI